MAYSEGAMIANPIDMKIEHLQQFSDTLTPVRVCRVAQGVRSAALPISAPPRLRASRSDAHRDAEHAEGGRTRRLLSMAGATLPNKTNLCENCYKSALPR